MARRADHPGHIQKRGDSFRVRLSVDGERHSFTLSDVTREEAEEFATSKHQELRAQEKRRKLGARVALPLSTVIKQFKDSYLPTKAPGTQRNYGSILKGVQSYFVEEQGDPTTDRILPEDIEDFLTWRRLHNVDGSRREKPLSNHTLRRDRAVLSKLFNFAKANPNPVESAWKPKGDPREPVILSDGQYEKLLEECAKRDDFLWLYCLLLAESGLRSRSEALWLRWEDLKFDEKVKVGEGADGKPVYHTMGFLHVVSGRGERRTKSGKSRWVPMTDRLRSALREHAAKYRMQTYNGKRSPWVFHHRRRNRGAKPGDRIEDYSQTMAGAIEDAKLPDRFRVHDLRACRITWWLAEGKPVVKVKEAVGHENVQTTMGYLSMAREHLHELVDAGDREREELAELVD